MKKHRARSAARIRAVSERALAGAATSLTSAGVAAWLIFGLLALSAPKARAWDLTTCLRQLITSCDPYWRAVEGSQLDTCDDTVRRDCLAASATVCFEMAIRHHRFDVASHVWPKGFDMYICLDHMKWDCREPFQTALESLGPSSCEPGWDSTRACETAAPAVCWQFGAKKRYLGSAPGGTR